MKRKKLNLYQKFALVMVALGLFPILVLVTFIFNSIMENYQVSLQENYKQAAIYMCSSVENMLTIYDNASTLLYQYSEEQQEWNANYSNNYDNLRQILAGEIYEPEVMEHKRSSAVTLFLKSIENIDSYIYSTHLLTDNEEIGKMSFHFSLRNTFFKNEDVFSEMMNFEQWDRSYKGLYLLPTHETHYFNGAGAQVFTVARNYYDIRGVIGKEKYVGTLFINVDIEKLKLITKKMGLDDTQQFYLVSENGDCFFSNQENCIGKNLVSEGLMPQQSNKTVVIATEPNAYGMKVIMTVDTCEVFDEIYSMRYTMYLFLIACAVALMVASLFFSRRLTRPIHNMMNSMSQMENGNFEIELPVESEDEIGVLSARFNRMSQELKNYINQSYVAQIKKNEAELTALKSQIYPHFLYNTLEIIRMTALENDDLQVSQMIEALSEQIHYLIGPFKDMVSLEKEVDIVSKYVYLLNCRIEGKIVLNVNAPGSKEILVPRLILQPIVENAYVHGIKPKKSRGCVMIEALRKDNILEISVMDNGVGMDAEAVKQIGKLLEGNEPGIKNEYNWQSIGLKNVHDRIRYLYGDEYGIHLTSNVGVGTIVQVILPWQEVEKQECGNEG